jgi:hypothetical protein
VAADPLEMVQYPVAGGKSGCRYHVLTRSISGSVVKPEVNKLAGKEFLYINKFVQ